MNKPRIALLIDWYLPGTRAGGPVRSVYSLVNILKEQFDLYIITSNLDLGSSVPYPNIQADELFVKDGVHFCYFSKNNLTSANMLSVLSKVNPDLIYLNSYWSFNFSINIIRLKNKGLIKKPVLLAPRGMLGYGALKIKPLKKKLYLKLANALNWYKDVHFHATQLQEKSDILKHFKNAGVSIAPNINSTLPVPNKTSKNKNELKLFFLSRISLVKNLKFGIELLAHIPSKYRIEYDIYGNLEEKEYWKSCLEIINALPENISVKYKGEIDFDKIQPTISNYHCLFLPTFNENYGHSIVESLLCGCPAIISDQTPWNDLEQYNAGYALPLDDKTRFINAIIQLAELDEEEFRAKSNSSIAYISGKIKPAEFINQYKNLFNARIKNGSLHI